MKREAGHGSITTLKNGRKWARLSLADGTRRSLGTYTTEEEAQRAIDAALVLIAEEKLAPVGGITLRTYGQKWLDRREDLGVRGIKIERNRWKNLVETASFADLPIRAIGRADVREHVERLLTTTIEHAGHPQHGQPRSVQTVRRALNLLSLCLDDAVEKGHIAKNPAEGMKTPKDQRTEEPWTYLTPEEQSAILTCEKIPFADRLLVQFAIGTGLRQGELWALRLVDVVLEGDPHITVRFGSPGKPTKTGRIRRVPLFGIAAAALVDWLPLLAKQKNPKGLVFPGPSGKARQRGKFPSSREHKTASALWAEYLDRAKIGRHVRFYDLRHTFGSSLVAGWWGHPWRLEEIKEAMGHTSILMTQRYAHLADSALKRSARVTLGLGYEAPLLEAAQVAQIVETAESGPTGTRTRDLRIKRPELLVGNVEESGHVHQPVTDSGEEAVEPPVNETSSGPSGSLLGVKGPARPGNARTGSDAGYDHEPARGPEEAGALPCGCPPTLGHPINTRATAGARLVEAREAYRRVQGVDARARAAQVVDRALFDYQAAEHAEQLATPAVA